MFVTFGCFLWCGAEPFELQPALLVMLLTCLLADSMEISLHFVQNASSQMVFHILMTSVCLFWNTSMPAGHSYMLQWVSNAVLWLVWDFLLFLRDTMSLSCPESPCPERIFPYHLSSHICLFSSSYPDLMSLFHDVVRIPVPWTVHM